MAAKGILRYRGYPIEQLVAESSYLEVAYLLVYGELPSCDQLAGFSEQVKFSNGYFRKYFVFYRWFPQRVSYDGDAGGRAGRDCRYFTTMSEILEPKRHNFVIFVGLIGNVAAIGAAVHRRSAGLPYVSANPELGFYGNFLNMLFGAQRVRYLSALIRCSSARWKCCSFCTPITVRIYLPALCGALPVEGADPYSSMAGAAAALYGPAHGARE